MSSVRARPFLRASLYWRTGVCYLESEDPRQLAMYHRHRSLFQAGRGSVSPNAIAVDYVLSRDNVDPKRLALSGHSDLSDSLPPAPLHTKTALPPRSRIRCCQSARPDGRAWPSTRTRPMARPLRTRSTSPTR